MAYVLKGVDKKYLKQHKSLPDKQILNIPIPKEFQIKHSSDRYGTILIDNRNISEVNNNTVDVTLYFDSYFVRLLNNDNKYIQETISSEDIYQQHVFMQLFEKEKNTTPNTPIYLRQVNKNNIFKDSKLTDRYTFRIPIPDRLQHIAKSSETSNAQYCFVEITEKKNVISNATKNTYDICLPHSIYTITFYDKNNTIRFFSITRGEVIEAFEKHKAISASKTQNKKTKAIDAESIASTANNSAVLRHINNKNISYIDDEYAIISVNTPASLKDRASTWWCTLNIPASNIVKEGKYKNNYFSSILLYQTEYTIGIPLTPTYKFHQDIRTKWEHVIVSRDELIIANEAHIRDQWEYFEDFDKLVEP